MKVLNILASGGTGGIERLCEDLNEKSQNENYYAFIFEEGMVFNRLRERNENRIISLLNLKGNIKKIIQSLNKYITTENIDIVVIHHGGVKCNLLYLGLIKKNKKVKFIRYLHGCYDNYSWGRGKNLLKNFIVDIIMKKALNSSDKIICISNASKESFIRKFKGIEEKISVIYNCVNDKFFENNITRDFDNQKNNLIYVGRIEYLKGLDNVIEVLDIVKNDVSIHFDIIGDGSYLPNVKDLVNKRGLQDHVTFHGRQDNIPKYLDKCQIFIYPSICEEGFGISVAEALARGCIPIVSNKGGLPEVVNYNSNFIYNDNDELKKIIVSICNYTPEEKKNISDMYKEFSTKFKIDNAIKKLDEVYNEVIK